MLDASVAKCTGRKMKMELSEAEYNRRFLHGKLSGENNPNSGGKLCRGFADNPIIGFEDYYGKEKADALRKIRSINSSGENNSQYGKPSSLMAGRGISGTYKEKHFRSLLELYAMIMFETQNKMFVICESNSMKFAYTNGGRNRTYFPDFYLPDEKLFIEIKPLYQSTDNVVQLKLQCVKNHGEKIKLLTEKDIPKVHDKTLKVKYDVGELTFHTPKCEKFISKLMKLKGDNDATK